ncbi:copper amine oxidase N-terminal domain-containing protein [Marinicrinis lubricantis]|uniref:Copper amine oxidase N-terminal domain-containing protein n=1 Tax=Marinicrinis lubricantis TaxID=2086470 RepID=A0ABW1IQ14_9BACL
MKKVIAAMIGIMIISALNIQWGYSQERTPFGYYSTESNRIFVPLRLISEQFSANVKWEPARKEITILRNNLEIKCFVDHTSASVNGTEIVLDAAPFAEDGVTYVPIRFIADSLGVQSEWKSVTQMLQLKWDNKQLKLPVIQHGSYEKRKDFEYQEKRFEFGGKILAAHVLKVDLFNPKLSLSIGLAKNQLGQVDDLLSIAKDSNAVAAINGTYFNAYTEENVKQPYGAIVIDGEWFSAAVKIERSFGLTLLTAWNGLKEARSTKFTNRDKSLAQFKQDLD